MCVIRVLVAALCVATPAPADDDEACHVGPVTGIATNRSDIYSCSQAGVLKFDGNTNAISTVVAPAFRVTDVATIGDQQLGIGGGRPGESGTVGIVELSSGKMTTHKFAHDLVYAVAVSPLQKSFAAACADGKIVLFDLPLDVAKPLVVIHKHTATARAVAFSGDGKFLISGGLDGVILMTEIADSGSTSGETRALQEHTEGIECLAFSPDGNHFASGARDSKVRLHSIDGRLIRTYSGIGMEDEPAADRVSARVWALAWRKDQFIAGTSKGTLYRLSLADDTWSRLERRVDTSIYALAFSVDGSLWIGSQSLLAR